MADAADDLIAWERIRRSSEQGNALGALRSAAGRRDADQERAVRLAADNLLDKALRRIDDEPAARKLVERAFLLPLEGSPPGAAGALAVHLYVWDALREVALDGKHEGWLDRAEAAALEGQARLEWLAALRALGAEGEIGQDEQRRIRALAGRSSDHDPFTGVAQAERIEATLQLLRAVRGVQG